MSDYARANSGGSTHFGDKDALTTGDPDKVIVGSQFDSEFNAIVTAVATKYDSGDIASEAVAEALTSNTTLLTPLRLDNVLKDNGGLAYDIQQLSDPGADRILFWDDGAGEVAFLQVSTGLTLSGTTLTSNDSAIVHDNLSGFVANEHIDHSGVTLTAGAGLTGGGTIAASRSFAVGAGNGITVNADDVALTDQSATSSVPVGISSGALTFSLSGITEITAAGLSQSADGVLISDAGTLKVMPIDNAGVIVVNSAADQTFAITDANTYQILTGTTDRTWTIPPNSSVAFTIGTWIMVGARDTADITIDPGSGVALTSILENAGTTNRTVLSGGSAVLIKVATDEWMLVGDIS